MADYDVNYPDDMLFIADIPAAIREKGRQLQEDAIVKPAVHKASHAAGGTDVLTPADIGAVAANDYRLSNARPADGGNADTVEGYHAGIGANQVLVLDGSAKVSSVNLPVANSTTLGGVKIGSNINVDANGVISVPAAFIWTDTKSFTGSAQPNWQGNPVATGAGGSVLTQITGVPAGTYTLVGIIQDLITRSHNHGSQAIGGVNCNCNCNCTCNCDGSCFVAGSKVLMWDSTWKNIEEIVIGDKVIGLNGEINTVLSLMQGFQTSILTFEKSDELNPLYFSSGHNFWVKVGEKEVWGTNDLEMHLNSHGEYYYVSYDIAGKELPYATTGGWMPNKAVPVEVRQPVQVYQLGCSGSHSFIVNGYVVSGKACTFNDFDWNSVKWEGLN